jgi:hypothetical protein
MNRESQGGGTVVECRMSGSISSDEYSFQADSEILEEGGAAPETTADAPDDTSPVTEPATEPPATTDTTEGSTTPSTVAPPTTTGTDDSTRMTYENGVLAVVLDDLQLGPAMQLSLKIGTGLEFGELNGLPNYLITSTQLPTAIVNINLSPTFGDNLAEIEPDAPSGYAVDLDISNGAMVGSVQQLNGAADSSRLYGTAVIGDWKAQLVVYVNGAALDSGAVTMEQAATLLTKIMQSFTVTPA